MCLGSLPRPPEAKFGRETVPSTLAENHSQITRGLHADYTHELCKTCNCRQIHFFAPRLHADYTRITRTVLFSFDRKFKGFVKGAAVSEAR